MFFVFKMNIMHFLTSHFIVRRNLKSIFRIHSRQLESIASTIYALSTNIKNTGSAIAVIRVSGQETLKVIDLITNGKACVHRKNPRKSLVHNYYDPKTLELIDNGMILWFPKPKSYTGEDVCEFHVHGSPAVISKMLMVLGEINGLRPAREGEFTRRALINGKLRMIQAEGIRDLINARTENQRRRALNGVSGSLDKKFDVWRQTIIKLMAHMEAYIDFAEEELIDPDLMTDLKRNIAEIAKNINDHIEKTKQKSDLIKDGFHISIIGQANVGKSSLINRLSEKDVSIISPLSGTTRDVVETWMDIAGNSVCIADTAGIKDLNNSDQSIDIVEEQGIKKAILRAKQCHLVIVMIDALEAFQNKKLIFPEHLQEILSEKSDDESLYVVNKIDLLDENQRKKLQEIISSNLSNQVRNTIHLSCVNNEGFSEFFNHLKHKIEIACSIEFDQSMQSFSNERHVINLKDTVKELKLTLENIDLDIAISAFHLKQASYYLGCLTGDITTEHVLDVIFKDFCIGK